MIIFILLVQIVKRCFTETNVLLHEFNEIIIMEREAVIDESSEIPSLFKMTRAQEERSERNRLKAKALQHSRHVRKHPYTKLNEQKSSSNFVSSSQNFTDTCGGYMLEDEDSENAVGHVILAEDEGMGN